MYKYADRQAYWSQLLTACILHLGTLANKMRQLIPNSGTTFEKNIYYSAKIEVRLPVPECSSKDNEMSFFFCLRCCGAYQ